MCKGANAAGPRAKVQRWMQPFQVAGGSPGWQVAGRGATAARPMGVRGGRVADASLPRDRLGQHAVLPLPARQSREGAR